MIPYAILQAELITSGRTTEIRILDLSFDSFTFRLPMHCNGEEECSIHLYFLDRGTLNFKEAVLRHVLPVFEEEEEGYRVYRVITEDPSFHAYAGKLMKEYREYMQWKLHDEDAVMSLRLCRYPAEQETVYAESFSVWMKSQLDAAEERISCADWKQIAQETKLGAEIESEKMRQAFLQMDQCEFRKWYMKRQKMEFHPLSSLQIRYVYFGNAFCFHRMPSVNEMVQLLEKAVLQGMIPVAVLPALKQRDQDSFMLLLQGMAHWAKGRDRKLEVVVNDYGTLNIIAEQYSTSLKPVMGILLNKRRKDSRIQYRLNAERQKELLQENSMNFREYRDELKIRYGADSAVYESCGYAQKIPEGEQTVYFPFYQMNTAGHCTLYAACRHKDRSVQSSETDCPMYCREYMFLYPKMLKMFGYGNTVSAYDDRVLIDPICFRSLSASGHNRMVLMDLHLRDEGGEEV